MPEDETIVQPEQTPEESGSKTEETTPKVEPQKEQPLTKDEVARMIAEATAKAIEEARETGRRELQSQQDKNKAELARLKRRAELSENLYGTARKTLQTSNPEASRELENLELKEKLKGYEESEQENSLQQQVQTFRQSFLERQGKFLTDLGIDPNDSRVDWAKDAMDSGDYLSAMERIQASVAQIQKSTVQGIRDDLDKRLKALETQTKESDIEANSVRTATSGGFSGDGMPTDLDTFRTWVANLSQDDYEKNEKAINERYKQLANK